MRLEPQRGILGSQGRDNTTCQREEGQCAHVSAPTRFSYQKLVFAKCESEPLLMARDHSTYITKHPRNFLGDHLACSATHGLKGEVWEGTFQVAKVNCWSGISESEEGISHEEDALLGHPASSMESVRLSRLHRGASGQ